MSKRTRRSRSSRERTPPRGGRAWKGVAPLLFAAVTVWTLYAWLGKGPGPTDTTTQRSSTPPERILPDQDAVFSRYAGSESCAACHPHETQAWKESHHHWAERPVLAEMERPAFEPGRSFEHGTQSTRLRWGAEGPEALIADSTGTTSNQKIERVIGHSPLRQYLVKAEGGRLQTLEASWDPHAGEWFNVYGSEDRQPGEWGHWTGRGMNWNSMCATCHNTRYRKNYEPASDAYRPAMAEATVSCEACHGPMREHVRWQQAWYGQGRQDPTLQKIAPAQWVETCAPCHARRSELTGDIVPGASFWDHFLLSIVDGSEVFHPDGQVREEDYEYAPFLGSRMHAAGVTCLDCHDPHRAAPKMMGNDLCMQCHNGSRVGSPVIDPLTHTFHSPESAGSQCVNCHMPQTVFMQRDARHDHGFTTPDPLLTLEFGIPNACNRCHTDRDAAWARDACEQWYGSRMNRPARARTRILARARQGDESAVDSLLALLDSPETPYWKAAAVALLEPWITRPAVKSAVIAQSQHPHPLVRTRVVQALGPLAQSGDPEAQARIRAGADDSHRSVRVLAAWAHRRQISLESEAGRELRHWLNFNSDQPTGQAQWGAFHLARGNLEQAREHYARAVSWDPGSPYLRHDYAVVLSLAGRTQEALEQTRESVRLEPEVAEHHYRLGLAAHEAGDGELSLKSLQEAVRLDPRHARALYNLALVYEARGRFDEALGSLAQAESADPADPRIPYARATIFIRLGQRDAARAAAARVFQLDPGNPAARELNQRLRQ